MSLPANKTLEQWEAALAAVTVSCKAWTDGRQPTRDGAISLTDPGELTAVVRVTSKEADDGLRSDDLATLRAAIVDAGFEIAGESGVSGLFELDVTLSIRFR